MAEEQQSQERTEEPTSRKLSKAREDGQVARSRELNTVALVMLGAFGLLTFVPWGGSRIMRLTESIFTEAAAPDAVLLDTLATAAVETMLTLAPLLLMVSLAGVLSSVAMGGLVFSTKAMAFKGSRMSPLKGLKRMFSAKSLVELGKSIAKFVLIAGVATLTLSVLLEDLLWIGALPLEAAVGKGLEFVGLGLLLIGSSLVVVALIDVPFQMHEHSKQLKMTKQEIKDEMKDSEGKPEVRSRIRQLQQEIARRRMLADIPDADVVITNPTHYAVAIRYDSGEMQVPVVVARGADLMAFRIREIAENHGVAVLQLPMLARAVYFNTEIGEEIPSGLYVAVARVLAYIYQLRQFKQGVGAAPKPLGAIDIPEAFRTAEE
ncbi:MAG: flagellar biosynthesis protein FlhB [Pseudomonadales bacterium]